MEREKSNNSNNFHPVYPDDTYGTKAMPKAENGGGRIFLLVIVVVVM